MQMSRHLDWLEQMHTLHYSVEILYVVTGYQITQLRDGEETGKVAEGPTLEDAINIAMAEGWTV